MLSRMTMPPPLRIHSLCRPVSWSRASTCSTSQLQLGVSTSSLKFSGVSISSLKFSEGFNRLL